MQRTIVLTVATFLGVFAKTGEASGPTWTRQDLRVGAVYSVAFDPTDADVVYLGTYAYLWKSEDRGSTWVCRAWDTSVTNPYTDPISIAVDPQDTSIVYVGGNGSHAFKSYDGALSWVDISNGLPIDSGITWNVLVDPADTSIVYAAIGAVDLYGEGGVYKSIDGGVTWSAANDGLRITNTWSLAMDPIDSSVLYAGSWGVHKSSNGGQTWDEVLPDLVARAIAVDPAGAVYAGMLFGQGIHKSTDGGQTWTPINTGLPPSPSVSSLAVDPADPSTVYAGTEDHGVFKTGDGGGSWSPLATGMEAPDSKRVWAVAVDPNDSSSVYAGTLGGGLFKSVDAGSTWNESHSYPLITSFAVSPQDPSDIVAGLAGTGVARSADGGQTWEHLFGDLYITDVFAVAMDPTDSATLYVGTSVGEGVYKSTDGGWVWERMYNGMPISPFANVWAVVVDPNEPLTVYAAADDDSGAYKTTDGAISWTAINNGLTDRTLLTLTLDPTDSAVLYAGSFSGQLFKSEDAGANWVAIGSGLPVASIRSIAVDPSSPSVVYAGTLGGGLYRSDDGGNTWSVRNDGLSNPYVAAILVHPDDSSIVYAGTGLMDPGDAIPNSGNGVYVSVDGGDTWAEMNAGLDNLKAVALAFVPGSPGTILAGTDGGGIFTAPAVSPVGIPAVSEWGLCVCALLLLTAGTVVVRFRLIHDPNPDGSGFAWFDDLELTGTGDQAIPPSLDGPLSL